jgi:hypothetical protein
MPGATSNPSTSTCPVIYTSAQSATCPQSLYYTVQATYTFQSVNNTGQSDLCLAGQPPSRSHPAVIVLQVTVSWDNLAKSVTATTNIPYPSPNVQTEGFLAVQLQNDGLADVNDNASSDRYQVVPITVTDSALSFSSTVEADANGCAFLQVPPGTYDVSLGQPSAASLPGYTGTPPYVTEAGATSVDYPNVIVAEADVTNVNAVAFDQGIDASLTYPSATDLARGVQCPGGSSVPCVAVGSDPSGLSTSTGGGGGTWSVSGAPGMTTLSQVACGPNGSVCVAVGSNGGVGAIDSTSGAISSAFKDTVPAGITNVTQVACPSNRGCYAIASNGTAPVLRAGTVTGSSATWTTLTVPNTTFSSLTALACPTSSTCELAGVATTTTNSTPTTTIVRMDGDPDQVASNPSWVPTFTADTLPGVTTSVGAMTCPSSSVCEALAAGDATSASDPVILTTGPASSGASNWTAETLPAGATSFSSISCTASACLVAGIEGGAPGLWGADLTAGPHTWTDETSSLLSITGATSFAAVTGVACGEPTGGDTADCAVTATACPVAQAICPPSAVATGGTTAVLADGYLANGSWSWNLPSTPSVDTVDAYLGVSCEPNPSSSRADCAAVGVNGGAPVILDTTAGPGGAWQDHTPTYTGSVASGIPVEMTPKSSTSWSTVVAGGAATNTTSLSNLYPESTGYGLVAADCPAAATTSTTASFTEAPGVPLGLLSLQLQGPGAAPVSGATITLQPTTCSSDTFTFTMPATDANGFSALSVPFGTYRYTVKVGGTTTPAASVITVNPTDVLVGSTPYYLSVPAVVPSS